jgi:hypothetical protein
MIMHQSASVILSLAMQPHTQLCLISTLSKPIIFNHRYSNEGVIYLLKLPESLKKKDPLIKRGVRQRMSDQGLIAQTLWLYGFQKLQKYFAKSLTRINQPKYINKAPEEKRFTKARWNEKE